MACTKPRPGAKRARPRPAGGPPPCLHVWDFRKLEGEKGGQKYFLFKCLLCGAERADRVTRVRNLYVGRFED